jgi:lipoprotein NlpD
MMSIARALLLLLCAALAACAARPRAVVLERSTAPTVSRSVRTDAGGREREYLVARGDTLFAIAFRHGVDFRELARWNGIAAPYTIYPGQRLRLKSRSAPTPSTATTTRRQSPPSRPIVAVPPPTPPAAPARTPPASSPLPAPPPGSVPASPVVAPPDGGARVAQGVVWRWPASGQLVSRYVNGDPTRQGINIAGSSGQPVFAAAEGEVVYSGSGLIGYGELVIIKHSDVLLSAYGHNRKRLVSEGQRVAAGQQIAEMGRSGAARDMLHFEIRRGGKPIDPLPLLPKR